MVLFFRQTWTLTVKNLLVVLVRPLFTTVLRALVLPVFFVAFMSDLLILKSHHAAVLCLTLRSQILCAQSVHSTGNLWDRRTDTHTVIR
jgi:hypothetical protein